jgi:hypothetical protein
MLDEIRFDRANGAGELKRRGLIVAAAAVAAGVATKFTERPAAAASAIITENINTETTSTWIENVATSDYAWIAYNPVSGSYGALTSATFLGQYNYGGTYGTYASGGTYGTYSYGGTYGVYGYSPNSTGVYGVGNYYGLIGYSANYTGAYAYGASYGVLAYSSTSGTGLYTSGSHIGVNAFASSVGVAGYASAGHGGEFGSSTSIGVFGYSNTYVGVYASSASSYALYASSGSSWAGVFSGPVFISGNFIATGTKSAAVKAADGTSRLMYALETPENLFEDVGSASLRKGQATVSLDPTFAGVITSDKYHVFLTAQGESNGLYVSRKTTTGFEVREQSGGSSNVDFSYRIVALRKDTTSRGRMEQVELPSSADQPSSDHLTAAKTATPASHVPTDRPQEVMIPSGVNVVPGRRVPLAQEAP